MKKNKLFNLLTCVIFTVIGGSIYAQQSLDKVIKSYIDNNGGIIALKSLQNIEVNQLMYSNNMEIPQKLVIVNNKAMYQESDFPNGKFIVSIKNGKGWTISPYIGNNKVKDLSPSEYNSFYHQTNLLGPIYDYFSKNDKSKHIR